MRPPIPPHDRKKSAGPSERAPSGGLPRQLTATSSLLVPTPEAGRGAHPAGGELRPGQPSVGVGRETSDLSPAFLWAHSLPLLGLPCSRWLAVGVPSVPPALRTDVDVCTAQDPENVHPSLWAGSTSFGKSARRKLPQGPLCGSPSHLLWRPVLVLDLKFIWKVACEENGSWSPLLCAFLTAAASP